MFPGLLEDLDDAEHEQWQVLQDPEIGFWAVLAVHSTRHGPAFGGVRRFAYRSRPEAFRDALRLATAMTYKCVMARVPGGGGKCVILDGPDLDVDSAYRLLGRYVENMRGRFYTGPDLGTGPAELGLLQETTRYVTVPGQKGPGDLARATARGVLAGLRAVVGTLRGEPAPAAELAGTTYAVQGLGGVGYKVAAGLVEGGGRVFAADEDRETLQRAVDELGVEPVEPGAVFDVECDVFVPCALGGILHDLTIERMRCRAIAGSANNILAAPEHAVAAAARDILVAPDYVINSGALILGATFHLTGQRDQSAIDRIGGELFELFARAKREKVAPPVLADEIARERLAEPPIGERYFFPEGG